MATTLAIPQPLLRDMDPVLKFLVDGGSWADAMELEATLRIPVLEAQLKAAFKKQNPSGEAHRQRLLKQLKEDYAYLGRSTERADKFFQDAEAAYLFEKAQRGPKAAAVSTPPPKNRANAPPQAPVKAPRPGRWAALDDEDSD